MRRELVYIGNRFYLESGTQMGSMLEKIGNEYHRAGIGDVELYVDDGDEVLVRPASPKEMRLAEAELARIKGGR